MAQSNTIIVHAVVLPLQTTISDGTVVEEKKTALSGRMGVGGVGAGVGGERRESAFL